MADRKALVVVSGGPANITTSDTLVVGNGIKVTSGNLTISGVAGSAIVVNEDGIDVDFRIEGDTDANLFVTDAATSTIGIGGAVVADTKLNINTTASFPLRIQNAGVDRFFVLNNGAYQTRFYDGSDVLTGLHGGLLDGSSYLTSGFHPATYISNSDGSQTVFWTLDRNNFDGVFYSTASGTAFIDNLRLGRTRVVFNEGGADVDFRVEGDTDANLLFVDAGLDQVAIGHNSPTSKLHVASAGASTISTTQNTLASGVAALHAVGSSGAAGLVTTAFVFNTSAAGTTFGRANAGLGGIYGSGTNLSGFVVGTNTADPLILGTADVERISVAADGTIVVNETGANADVRIEGDTDVNLLVTDADLDCVIIGNGTGLANSKLVVQMNSSTLGGGAVRVRNVAVSSGEVYIDVNGSTAAGTGLAGPSKTGIRIFGTAVTGVFGTAEAAPLLIGTNNTERISIASDGTIVVNEGGVDADVRFESDTNPNLLYLDAGFIVSGIAAGAVGIGAVPTQRFYVEGADTGTIFSLIKNTASTGAAGIGAHNDLATSGLFLRSYGSASAATVAGVAMASGTSLNAEGAGVTSFVLSVANNVPLVIGQSGTERARFASGGVIHNEDGNDYDFRVEGDTDANLFVLDAGLDRAGVGVAAGSHAAKLHVAGGSLSSTINALRVTGTLSAIAATQVGSHFDIATQAGPNVVRGQQTLLGAGATPSTESTAILATNAVAGVGATVLTSTSPAGNWSFFGSTSATTVGSNVGGSFYASNGNKNFGAIGLSLVDKASAQNVGLTGAARNNGASGINIGGIFYLANAALDPVSTATSAALIADNVDHTAPIFIARDNGSPVFIIADGGYSEIVTLGAAPSAPSAGFGRLYAKTADKHLYWKDSDDAEYDLTGAGTVSGPGSSTDMAIARFDGATGTIIDNSRAVIDDDGLVTFSSAYDLIHTFETSGTAGHRINNGVADLGFVYETAVTQGADILPAIVFYDSTQTGFGYLGFHETDVALYIAIDNDSSSPPDQRLFTKFAYATGTTFNPDGADLDFVVQGDTDANLLIVDAGLERVGIGTSPASSGFKLQVAGNVLAATSANTAFRVSTANGSTTGQFEAIGFADVSTAIVAAHAASVAGTNFGQNKASSAAMTSGIGNRLLLGTTHAAPLYIGTNDVERMSISSAGVIVFNETGVDADIRFESDTDANLLYLDAGALTALGAVGIGTNAPTRDLHVLRNVAASGVTAQVENTAADGAAQFIAQEPNVQLATLSYGATFAGSTFGQTNAGKAALLASGTSMTGLLIGTTTSDSIYFGTNGTSAMTINTSQQVIMNAGNTFGIGGTPNEAIDIQSSGAGSRGGIARNSTTNGSAKWELSAATNVFGGFYAWGTGSVGLSYFGTVNDGFVSLVSSGSGSTGMKIGAVTSDPVILGTNDVERVTWGATAGVVFNEGGNDYDFRVEGDTDANLITADAGLDQVGVGTVPTSKLHVGGSFAAPTTSVSVDTTLNATHYTVRVDASGGAKTMTLPAAATCTGRIYHVKKTDSSGNAVTIDGDGAETIDGATTQAITAQYATLTVQSNGTGWDIL